MHGPLTHQLAQTQHLRAMLASLPHSPHPTAHMHLLQSATSPGPMPHLPPGPVQLPDWSQAPLLPLSSC